MSYLDWHAGMKVVYIDDADHQAPKHEGESYPEVGRVYTIRNICISAEIDGEQIGIRLVEIVNPENPRRRSDYTGSRELGFRARRFRPVQKRKTDISIFERLLKPSDSDTFRELEAEVLDYDPIEVPFR